MTDLRDKLNRTGVLQTWDPEGLGYVSEFWREQIRGLLDAVEYAPHDAAEQMWAERAAHRETATALATALAEVESLREQVADAAGAIGAAADARAGAIRLIEDAIPRMRSLNNAMSPGWLARADEWLKGTS